MINKEKCLELMNEMSVIAENLTLNRLDVCMESLLEIAPVLVKSVTDYLCLPQANVGEEYKNVALAAIQNFTEAFNCGDLVSLADSMRYELREVLEYIVKSE